MYSDIYYLKLIKFTRLQILKILVYLNSVISNLFNKESYSKIIEEH